MKTLYALAETAGMSIDDHLDDLEIPVHDRPQAQGDVIFLPLSRPEFASLPDARKGASWSDVTAAGVELLRGQHPHTLVADAGACRWTADVDDPTGLALGIIDATESVHVLHAEHGGTGLAAGRWLVRRQREQAAEQRLVAD